MNKGMWIAVFLELLGAAGGAEIADGWVAQQISDNGYVNIESKPKVSQGYAAWHEYRDGYYPIFFWNGSTVQQISNSGVHCGDFYISGNYVVWTESVDGIYQVKQFNGSTIKQISSATTNDCSSLRISGSKAVWMEGINNLILWNGTSRQTLVTDGCTSPAIYGDKVAWIQDGSSWKVYLWNGTTTQIAQSTQPLDELSLSSNGQMVWLEKVDFEWENGAVMFWDGHLLEEPNQLSGSSNCTQPCLSEGYAAWIEGNQVMFWNGSSVSALTANSKEKLSVAISGQRVVWNEKPSFMPVYLIYMRDADGTVRFTDMPGSYEPVVDGDNIVWIAFDADYDWQVFLTRPGQKAVMIPGDINNDQSIDLLDFSILSSNWLK